VPEIRSLTRQVPTEAVIDLGGDAVRVTFDRNGITPYLLSEMQTRLEAGNVMAVASMLAQVIMAWDVTDEGAPFPPSADNIGKLSVSALASLSRRIGDEAVPTSEEGNASNATSSSPDPSSTVPQANPQNGPEPSLSPPPSESLSTR
jgi:hypothetical protein